MRKVLAPSLRSVVRDQSRPAFFLFFVRVEVSESPEGKMTLLCTVGFAVVVLCGGEKFS